jgi:hypothetical protein
MKKALVVIIAILLMAGLTVACDSDTGGKLIQGAKDIAHDTYVWADEHPITNDIREEVIEPVKGWLYSAAKGVSEEGLGGYLADKAEDAVSFGIDVITGDFAQGEYVPDTTSDPIPYEKWSAPFPSLWGKKDAVASNDMTGKVPNQELPGSVNEEGLHPYDNEPKRYMMGIYG